MLYWDPFANDGEGGYQDDGVYGDTPSIDFGTNPLEQPNYAVDPNSDPNNPLYGKDPTSSVEVLTPEERDAAVAAGMPTDPKDANSWLSGIKNSSIGKALGSLVTKQDGSTNWGALLAGGSALATMSGLNKPNRPPTGYQGGIPEYTASRAQLPIPNDPNRRPGQGGIRYMSDLQYLPKSAASATTPVAPAASPVNTQLLNDIAFMNEQQRQYNAAHPVVKGPKAPPPTLGMAAVPGGSVVSPTTPSASTYTPSAAASPTSDVMPKTNVVSEPIMNVSDLSLIERIYNDAVPNPNFVSERIGDNGAAPFPNIIRDMVISKPVQAAAQGGIMGYAKGRYLQGNTDGMADKIPAQIGRDQPAALSHGEFVIPADVVSHIGNGNSDAGAERLYSMMDKIRQARTGTKKQGKQINPDKFMPDKGYAAGGIVGFADGGTTTLPAGTTGVESKLSSWAGPYVTDMLGKGQALANEPYQAYQGPLTAGASNLQNQAFGQASNLSVPGGIGQAAETAGGIASKAQGMSYNPITSSFDANAAQQYMNPYLKASLDPQIEEARRQSQITQMQNDAKMTGAGAFGGGRSAILNAETQRSLGTNLANITGQGYNTAYNNAQQQFNADQARKAQEAQFGATYGLSGLNTALQASQTQGQLGTAQNQAQLGNLQALGNFGETQRGIESQGIAADKAAFEEERDRPYKQLQFQQSLLQGLPISSTQYNTADQSVMQQLMGAGSDSVALYKVLQNLGLADQTALTQKNPAATPTA